MKIKVLLFGILAEKAGTAEMEVDNIDSSNALTDHLTEKFHSFADYKFRISVNQTFINGNMKFQEGDEVALLPPFAGG
ncbi:MAG: MoaD/ThiS family protein [Bacteroidales bacterium]|nr:MoaD/ThiS family protein [Bacteroidales bacterium]